MMVVNTVKLACLMGGSVNPPWVGFVAGADSTNLVTNSIICLHPVVNTTPPSLDLRG